MLYKRWSSRFATDSNDSRALAGSYELRWRDFSRVEGGRYGTFRYLVVEVA